MSRLLEFLLGGSFVVVHISSTCEWMEWRRTRDTRLARFIDGALNPN